ncbi:MAG TPA: helix-turn-helix domain-containing protein [Candidatus Saccharimonadales bacterium]|nr:helix-turn-helix domain-containing protein [Candidatus Saccharimonadales bacterium]
MKRTDIKSHCPVNFALESFGDPWSLLIVRDIVFWGKHTYGEFLASREGISTNILASRLAHLEQRGIIEKKRCEDDKRKDLYVLTEKGLELIPMLLEMSRWSSETDPLSEAPRALVEKICEDRTTMFGIIQDAVSRGNSLFNGPESVAARMGVTHG